MSQFRITAKAKDGSEVVFLYDNMTSELTEEGTGKRVVPLEYQGEYNVAAVVTPAQPGTKTGAVKTLKISLGLSCNYSCDYCSQRFVPHADSTNPNDIDPFLAQLEGWFDGGDDGLGKGVTIEYWGGEPFVYWKTLKPLAEKLKLRYPNARMSVITNGSLLDKAKNTWLDEMDFAVGISHDGPGQFVRGPDPLEDPKSREAILDLYGRLRPQGRISFNSMVNANNCSRIEIVEFFVKLTGDPSVPVGEGSFVDAYDEGGQANSLKDSGMASAYRNLTFMEIRSGRIANMNIIGSKMNDFMRSVRTGRPATALGQKCGMDKSNNIAVDLNGNVLTCQNVSAASVAPNGHSHKIGHVTDLANVKLDTATHWSAREECGKCPVLQLCKGACMFLEGDLWESTCENSFSDNVPILAASLEFMTGAIPFKIEGPHRADRHAIWEVAPAKKPKTIPIHAV